MRSPHRPEPIREQDTNAFGFFDVTANVDGNGGADLAQYNQGPGTRVARGVGAAFGGYANASYFYGPDHGWFE